ncbi:MAG: hypothetical protein JSV04_06025, partial [Candidatus Heimdallarchaeota archaeon]
CKNCGSELLLMEEFRPFHTEEHPDVFNHEERDSKRISFNIEKSGSTEEIYRFSYLDDRDLIMARRSTLNRVGIYIFFLIAFLVIAFWGINYVFIYSPDFGEAFISYLISGIIQLLLALVLMAIINTYLGLRRITVYDENELPIGRIRGNLFFTRWRVFELTNANNASATFRFALFRPKGEMKTSSRSFLLSVSGEIVFLKDEHGELFFSVHSLDSIYIRRKFRIDSNGQLNPLLICLASICIIERMFRPKTEPD